MGFRYLSLQIALIEVSFKHIEFVNASYGTAKKGMEIFPFKAKKKCLLRSGHAFSFFATNYHIFFFYLDFFKNKNQIAYFEVKLAKTFGTKRKYFPKMLFHV